MRQVAKYYAILGKQTFSPLDLSPALWLDASDTATITASLGSVSQWDDKSGNGRHFAQGTAAAQPTTGTRTANGLNVIDWDGNDIMEASVLLNEPQPITMFVVAEPDTIHYGRLLTTRVAETTLAFLTTGRLIETAGTNLISPISTYAAGNLYLLRGTLDSTSSTIHLDGVQVASGNAGTNGFTGSTINRLGAFESGLQHFDGVIAEMIVVAGGLLTAQQISDTEAYLVAKWGL